ncbi:MAG: hypothetical protein GY867_12450 [bacterium]|nr:hypothetical protein [bacterium]
MSRIEGRHTAARSRSGIMSPLRGFGSWGAGVPGVRQTSPQATSCRPPGYDPADGTAPSRLEAGAPSTIVVVHTRYASLYHPEVRYAL